MTNEELTMAILKSTEAIKKNIQPNELLDCITNLREENEKLKEVCDKYEEEHSTKFNEWVFDKRENEKLTQLWLDSQEKIRKAIEFINKYCIDDEFYINLSYKEKAILEVLKILEGDDKE